MAWAIPTSPVMSIDTRETCAGYRWCHDLARAHYENFPVASFLLPKKLRDPVAAIYAFARSADDIADEGDLSDAQRLTQLDDMAAALHRIENHQPLETPLYLALADSIQQHRLPMQPFHDLLSAFRLAENHFRQAGAQLALVVEAGSVERFGRKAFQFL